MARNFRLIVRPLHPTARKLRRKRWRFLIGVSKKSTTRIPRQHEKTNGGAAAPLMPKEQERAIREIPASRKLWKHTKRSPDPTRFHRYENSRVRKPWKDASSRPRIATFAAAGASDFADHVGIAKLRSSLLASAIFTDI